MGLRRLRLPATLAVTVLVGACGDNEAPCIETCVPARDDAGVRDASNDAMTGCPVDPPDLICPAGCDLRLEGDCFT